MLDADEGGHDETVTGVVEGWGHWVVGVAVCVFSCAEDVEAEGAEGEDAIDVSWAEEEAGWHARDDECYGFMGGIEVGGCEGHCLDD